jgi:hypothetical protein
MRLNITICLPERFKFINLIKPNDLVFLIEQAILSEKINIFDHTLKTINGEKEKLEKYQMRLEIKNNQVFQILEMLKNPQRKKIISNAILNYSETKDGKNFIENLKSRIKTSASGEKEKVKKVKINPETVALRIKPDEKEKKTDNQIYKLEELDKQAKLFTENMKGDFV